ncbi:hypothetical protein [Sorangium sp. So ce1097]|uniref:hypothetical protein n=1 Tax=Sorangium sp. So ce1097 TaxID=3133330 RepID=UPI003F62A407
MTNRNANKSSPGQPAGQGAAGDAAPQPHPPPQQQPSRGYDAPNFVPQEHPLLAHQRALSQDPRRRPDEGAPGPAAAPPIERAVPWGEPRPRRRQDREAGPSDKQVYVPPVTLPPNREHQAMDMQKIQVAPSLLKGVDERNRPTMRRIPVHGMPAPPGAPDGPGSARPGGVRTARVGVGSGVWPPPEDPRKQQRPYAAPAAQPVAAAPRPGMPTNAARPDPAAAAAAALLATRRRGAPLGLFALLVFLGSATVAGFWVLWRAANPRVAEDVTRADESRGQAPGPTSAATPAPSTPPEPPSPATPPPVATVEQPPPIAEQPPPAASAAPAPSAPHARPGPVTATRPPSTRPTVQAKRPPKPPTTPEDVYEPTANTPPSAPQPLPSAPAALPSAPPGTTAPPRPFP